MSGLAILNRLYILRSDSFFICCVVIVVVVVFVVVAARIRFVVAHFFFPQLFFSSLSTLALCVCNEKKVSLSRREKKCSTTKTKNK